MTTHGIESQTILVVGGGIAGITAAVEAAEVGYDVILLEQSPTLGGRVAQLNRYFPKLCHPTCGLEINFQRLRKTSRVRVMTMSSVDAVEGGPGNYRVKVRTKPRHVKANCTACGDCAAAATSEVPNSYNNGLNNVKAAYLPHEMAYPMRYVIDPSVIGSPEAETIKAACKYDAIDLEQSEEVSELPVGAVIWATGWRPYPAEKIEPYGYGRIPNVITNIEMERLAAMSGPTAGQILRPADGKAAKKVALIQCAGSRDHNHLPYCSRICCLASFKHATYLREQYADAEVDIYYIDIRAHDKLDAFAEKVRADEHVHMIKSKPASIEAGEDGNPIVIGENTLTRELYAEPYDMVVLATGMQASTAALSPPGGVNMDDYGFIVPEIDDGMIAAGVAGGPFDVSMSVQSATAAALKAIQIVSGGQALAAAE